MNGFINALKQKAEEVNKILPFGINIPTSKEQVAERFEPYLGNDPEEVLNTALLLYGGAKPGKFIPVSGNPNRLLRAAGKPPPLQNKPIKVTGENVSYQIPREEINPFVEATKNALDRYRQDPITGKMKGSIPAKSTSSKVANQSLYDIPKELQATANEARQYKSAEVWMANTRGIPDLQGMNPVEFWRKANSVSYELPIPKGEKITLYRGTSRVSGKEGNYYSPDKEFARSFTEAGRDSEIMKTVVKNSDIYKPSAIPKATDANAVDSAIKEATSKGYKYVWMDEGGVPSVFKTNVAQGSLPSKQANQSLYDKPLYHGTDAKFDDFDFKKTGLASNEKPLHGLEGAWFTNKKKVAGGYGKNIKEVNVDTSNFHVVNAKGATLNDFRDELWDAKKYVKDNNKSGLVVKNLVDNKDWSKQDVADHIFVVDKKAINVAQGSIGDPLLNAIKQRLK
jgi:hypothetical protein